MEDGGLLVPLNVPAGISHVALLGLPGAGLPLALGHAYVDMDGPAWSEETSHTQPGALTLVWD